MLKRLRTNLLMTTNLKMPRENQSLRQMAVELGSRRSQSMTGSTFSYALVLVRTNASVIASILTKIRSMNLS